MTVKKTSNKTGVIGDLHFSDKLSYDDYVKGGRKEEKNKILDFIATSFEDCKSIIFTGDCFDRKNNSSTVVKEFTKFLEKFNDKEIYIIAGNHEKRPDGTSALDYLKEIKNRNWHIVTDKIENIGDIDLVPYFTKAELEVKTNEAGIKKVMKELGGNKILVVHYAISDSMTISGCSTNLFDEIVLNRKDLKKKYQLVIGGHIHKPDAKDNVLIAGSIFTKEVGEIEKFIYKIDEETLKIEEIKLPCREIRKIENPKTKDFEKVSAESIIKVIITDSKLKPQVDDIKKELKKFDASILIENYPQERRKVHFNKGLLDMKIEDLLKIYSKKNGVSLTKLLSAWEIVKL